MTWELIGGRRCGERVELDGVASSLTVAAVRPPSGSVGVLPQIEECDSRFLEGEYRAETAADFKRGILRWQGWR